MIAARVSGETGVTPVGALGKVTQLTYGVVTPGDMAANLMTANITGGGLIDCQMHTPHLVSLGARDIARSDFIDYLETYVDQPPPGWDMDATLPATREDNPT